MGADSNAKKDSEVLKSLILATGISENLISSEIKALSVRAGVNPNELTIEDLRQILAEYVQDVLLSAKEELDAKKAIAGELTPLFPIDMS